jgi:hypothetical protein
MSILGFAPFSALSFSAYFTYKEYLESHTLWNSDIIKVVGGGMAGISAVSVTYPTDLIRRRLQLQNFDKSVPKYSGILDCKIISNYWYSVSSDGEIKSMFKINIV